MMRTPTPESETPRTTCCGAVHWDWEEYDICPECREHCDVEYGEEEEASAHT